MTASRDCALARRRRGDRARNRRAEGKHSRGTRRRAARRQGRTGNARSRDTRRARLQRRRCASTVRCPYGYEPLTALIVSRDGKTLAEETGSTHQRETRCSWRTPARPNPSRPRSSGAGPAVVRTNHAHEAGRTKTKGSCCRTAPAATPARQDTGWGVDWAGWPSLARGTTRSRRTPTLRWERAMKIAELGTGRQEGVPRGVTRCQWYMSSTPEINETTRATPGSTAISQRQAEALEIVRAHRRRHRCGSDPGAAQGGDGAPEKQLCRAPS